MTRGLLVLAPLRLEAVAVRRGDPAARVLVTGVGPRRARRAAHRAAAIDARAVAVTGVCGALCADLAPGDLVVASELRSAAGTLELPGAEPLAWALRRHGLRAHALPLLSAARPVLGAARAHAAATGAAAADMESWWLAAAAAGRPFAVVRAVVDTPARELADPRATLAGGIRALRALHGAAAVLPNVMTESEVTACRFP